VEDSYIIKESFNFITLLILDLFQIGFTQTPSLSISKICTEHNITITATRLGSLLSEDPLWIYEANNETEVVLVWTLNQMLYRSLDSGKTWEHLIFPESSYIRTVKVSTDQRSIIVLGSDNHMWSSKNGGLNFTHLSAPGPMDILKFHPRNPYWILAQNIGKKRNQSLLDFI